MMVPIDYRRFCPNAGRALRRDEPGAAAGRRPRVAFCEACGRTVDVLPDPGTGRAFLYSMHDRYLDQAEAPGAGGLS